MEIRVGHGYDAHRFGGKNKLMLCGVEIPHVSGLSAHSDGDVAAHALCDALLGAAGQRDIGFFFPDTDESYKNCSGTRLLREVCAILGAEGFQVQNCDITIIAETPKLAPYIPQMKASVAAALGISPERAGVKATTEEGLGFGVKGIACHAVCLIEKRTRHDKTKETEGQHPHSL